MQQDMNVPSIRATSDGGLAAGVRHRVERLRAADWRSGLLPIAIAVAAMVIAACKGGGSSGY